MTDIDQAAAQLRSTLPTVEHAMMVVGIRPPEEWQSLKELVAAPPGAVLTDSAQGWANVKALIEQGGAELDGRATEVPAVWDSHAGAATAASLGALGRRQQTLSAGCDETVNSLHSVLDALGYLVGKVVVIVGTMVGTAWFISITFWAAPVAFTLLAIGGLIAAILGIRHAWNEFQTAVSDQCHNLEALAGRLGSAS